MFISILYFWSNIYALTNYIVSSAKQCITLFYIECKNTLVKFTQYNTEGGTFVFFILTVLFPFVDCSLVLIRVFFQEKFIFLSKKECSGEIILFIPFIGVCILFRDFHAWLRVYMHSGFGNFIKQVLLRVVALIPFLAVYYKWITVEGEFILLLLFSF
jgi:hypothetical protein